MDKLFQWWVWRGLALLGLGIFAITAPLVAAEWALALLGLYLTTAGLLNLLQAWLVGDRPSGWLTYVEGIIMTLAGVLVFLRPLLLLSGLLVLVAVALLVDGVMKLVSALRPEQGRARGWIALGGGVNVGLAVIVWTLRGPFSTVALGLVVGFYLLSQAWSTLLAPPEGLEAESLAEETNTHPDATLGLTPHAELGRLRAEAIAAARAEAPIDRYWMLTLVLVFMAIHIGRMDASLTWLGLLSPTVAVVGDLLVALVLGTGLVMPMRLWCRKLTRRIEAAAWRHRLSTDASRSSIADQLIYTWLDARLGFAVNLRRARGSLRAAAHMALAGGLPLTVVLVAMNPIWGFTWYFNTENWASGVWEKITEIRVDHWREAMVGAVRQARMGVGADPLALFDVHPKGVDGSEDFSFLVIGDTGEGDASQYVLHDRYVEIGRHPEVTFLVVSSDVIYPSGEMKDYEFNFYLPFKGFEKPIYAIPGNHDWYNALNGFLANFLEPDAARAAIAARVVYDFDHGITADEQTRYLVDEAARLRRAYGIRTGGQRAPFFQSFMEVGVERSRRQVRLRLHGVDGLLRWRDLQIGGGVMPPDQRPDDPVELIVRYPEDQP